MSGEFAGGRRIGRYVVYDAIASGGMATVHLARVLGPLGFTRTVAVKRMLPHLHREADLAVMLLDEARVSSRIQHPNVVQTLDVVSEAGELLVVMEYVHGESLAKLVRLQGRATPIELAAGIMVNVLHGLHAAHEVKDEAGVPLELVHRDVSPQNVLVGLDGVARLLDFGIAKAVGRLQTTRDGQVKGKLAYMSPEQLQSKPVDRRTDVFAAAVVLWELLTGARLFAREDTSETIGRVLSGAIAPPSDTEGVSPVLDEIVLRGLARSIDERFPTARAMADAIEAAVPIASASQIGTWVTGLAGSALASREDVIGAIERGDPRAFAAPEPSSVQTKSHESVSVDVEKPVRPRRAGLLAVGLLALVAVGGGVTFYFRRESTVVATAPSVKPEPSATESAAADVPKAPSAVPSVVSVVSASASVVPPAVAPPPVRTQVVPKPTATVDCTDPYTVDAHGRRRYRRECLK